MPIIDEMLSWDKLQPLYFRLYRQTFTQDDVDLLASSVPGLIHITPMVNKDVPVQNITSAHLAKLFKGEVKKWPDGNNVLLVLHSSSPGEMATLQHLSKMSEAEVKAMLAAHNDSARMVSTDADVIDAVASTPGAIGFVEEHSITQRVNVIRVDGKLPMESGYLPH